MSLNFHIIIDPDVPSFLGTYPMAPGTDYEKQTRSANGLRGSSITESSRVVCYNQTVYCDTRLELTEYFGLSIAVRASSTVRTEVDPIYGQTAIKIMDGSSSKFFTTSILYLYVLLLLSILSLQLLKFVWKTQSIVMWMK